MLCGYSCDKREIHCSIAPSNTRKVRPLLGFDRSWGTEGMPAAALDYPPAASRGCGAVLALQRAMGASLQASLTTSILVCPCPHGTWEQAQSPGLRHYLEHTLLQPLCQMLCGATGCSARVGGCTNSERLLSGLTPHLVWIVVAKCIGGGCYSRGSCHAGELALCTAETEERKQNLNTRAKIIGLFIHHYCVAYGTKGGWLALAVCPLQYAFFRQVYTSGAEPFCELRGCATNKLKNPVEDWDLLWRMRSCWERERHALSPLPVPFT